MSHIKFFIGKLNKGLLYSLYIGNQDIVGINITEIFKNCTIRYKLYNTGILYNYTVIVV